MRPRDLAKIERSMIGALVSRLAVQFGDAKPRDIAKALGVTLPTYQRWMTTSRRVRS